LSIERRYQVCRVIGDQFRFHDGEVGERGRFDFEIDLDGVRRG